MAAETFTVVAAERKKELPATAQRGPLIVWALKVKDGQGEVHSCERNKKPGNDLAEGQTLFGYLEPNGDFPDKFKEVVEKGGYGGGQTGGGGGGKYERQPDHPVQMQRALHTSSLSMAPQLIEQMLTIGVVEQPQSKADYLNLVTGVAQWVRDSYPADVLAQADKT